MTSIKKIEICVFSVIGLIALLAGSLFAYQYAYASTIYKNVKVADIDLSGKTKKQAAFLIQKKYDLMADREINFQVGDKTVKAKARETGLEIDSTKMAQNAFNLGRGSDFFAQIKGSSQTLWTKNEIKVEVNINKEIYDKFLAVTVAQLNVTPQDATLQIKDGEIVEITERDGSTIDTDDLAEKIMQLTTNSESNTITLSSKLVPATIKTADFTLAKQYATSVLSKKINFTYESNNFSPTKRDIGLWIAFANKDGKMAAGLRDDNIRAYLNNISKNIEVQKKDKKINAVDNAVLEEGQEGKLVDKDAALKQLKEQINTSTNPAVTLATYAVAPKELKIFPSEGTVAGRFEGRYIDIDVTTQKLCRIEGPTIIDCFVVSTGKASMPTPPGTYTIMEKNPRYWSNKYNMWLPYWQRLTSSGYGIHELPETNNWKETDVHLGTPVSHGCVRLGVGPAQTVFDWTSMGTTVYVHK